MPESVNRIVLQRWYCILYTYPRNLTIIRSFILPTGHTSAMSKHIQALSFVLILPLLMENAFAAGPRVLEVHSTFPRDLAVQGESAHHLNKTIQEISSGELKLEIYGAGEIVPAFEVFDAVSANAVSAGWDWIGYWANKVPVTGIIGSMPFGPRPDVYISWLYSGGGREILQKAYDKHNLWAIPCHMTLQEAGGWFNKEINSIEDFRGLKMRISGLGGKILNRVGASTQLFPGVRSTWRWSAAASKPPSMPCPRLTTRWVSPG